MKRTHTQGVNPSTGVGVGIVASVLLALLTLAVFYLLQDYGPESAIRKYNDAVLHGDFAAINQFSAEPVESPPGQWLYKVLQNYQQAQGRLALIGMDRQPTSVVAVVAFVSPRGEQANLPIVVTKTNHVWKVDPEATFYAYRRALGRNQGQ